MFEAKLEKLIIDNWNLKLDYVSRNILSTSDLKSKSSFAIIGPRRAGKSYLLYEIKQELIKLGQDKTDFISLNFENNILAGFNENHFEEILEVYSKLRPDTKPILLLDEIQNVNNWHKYIRKLVDNQYKVFVTGSNSNLLSKEIATHLGARTHPIYVYPLSFKEYLKFKGISLDKKLDIKLKQKEITKAYNEFFEFGGFPELVNLNNNRKKSILNEYLELVVNDIKKRWNITNELGVKLIIQKIRENVGREFSIKSIKKALDYLNYTIGENQLYDYFNYLKLSFTTDELSAYKKSFKNRLVLRKTYFLDNGYISLFDVDSDNGLKLENLIYTELKKSEKEIYYFKEKNECDFILKENKNYSAIQVTYELKSDNYEREIFGLTDAMNKFNLEKGIIITNNQKQEIKIDNKIIQVMPATEWILEMN